MTSRTKQIALDEIQMSGIPYTHVVSCITFKGLNLEAFVDDFYKKEAYLNHTPLNRHDLWVRTDYGDKACHQPIKKRRTTAGEKERSSHTHLSKRGQIQRCSIYGSVRHKKGRCPNLLKSLSDV
ncbi:hypothetical protein Ahy_A10g049924 [Arachis hypogaea]|uniref:Uncharacterized protein n=1 Tax=Arachis hypogaea TaxID=3818 RepID=A0A445B885_ARAHY|nr:hypothetical protein Ahy_A10g049924 [Arachis hypogaea]